MNTIKKDVMSELKKQFRPEFINRIDDIIVFHKLTKWRYRSNYWYNAKSSKKKT